MKYRIHIANVFKVASKLIANGELKYSCNAVSGAVVRICLKNNIPTAHIWKIQNAVMEEYRRMGCEDSAAFNIDKLEDPKAFRVMWLDFAYHSCKDQNYRIWVNCND